MTSKLRPRFPRDNPAHRPAVSQACHGIGSGASDPAHNGGLSRLPRLATLGLLPLLGALSGCNMVVMNASGDVAVQQGKLILTSTWLMLLIIVPVIVLTLWFAWHYRQSNTEAEYDPEWDHSTSLELVIWGAPLLIIIALGLITWISTHTLDPYRPLLRLDEKRAVPSNVKPLEVQVIALDWKWLFIYPEQGVASVNELVAPVDMPIDFKITSSTVMNSFFIPALAGQIYAMPGMETQLHAVINKAGAYQGFSANYSGAGFSHMNFKFHGVDAAAFDAWVAKTRAAGNAPLDRPTYLKLEQPSEREAVRYFASVAPDLYGAILNRCVDSKKMCMNDMMAIDQRGGMGVTTFRVAEKTPPSYSTAPAASPSASPNSSLSALADTGRAATQRYTKRYVEALACTADNSDPASGRALN